MVKYNLSSSQTSFEYACYMIASSYFEKPECKTRTMEKKMLLQYKEQKLDNQYGMEDICIAYMDKLSTKLPESFLKESVEIRLIKDKNGFTRIMIAGKANILELHATYAGKRSGITAKLWTKEPVRVGETVHTAVA